MGVNKFIAGSVLGCVALLTGCGGGGGGGSTTTPTVAPSADGPYTGTITGVSNPNFSLLALDNSEFWIIYGTTTSGVFVMNGIVHGTGSTTNGNFSSANAKDYGSIPGVVGTLAWTYNDAAKSITGSFANSKGTFPLTGTASSTQYNYNTPALLANVAGQWTIASTSGNKIAMTISATGSYSGIGLDGCTVTGTLTPRPSGKNVFNTTMLTGPAPCALPNRSGSGIATLSPLPTGTSRLTMLQIDSTDTYGTVSMGER